MGHAHVVTRLRLLLRALKALSRDPRIPRPVRWVLLASLLPVPGPFDEAVGLLALGLIAVFWRPVLRDVLRQHRDGPAAER